MIKLIHYVDKTNFNSNLIVTSRDGYNNKNYIIYNNVKYAWSL